MSAYYNEFDPYAAQWLRNLIKAGLIPDGVVDDRSIVEVEPEDLSGFTQCHFFAGIGGWALAARLAGWPDDRPLWTGSCPCQPFSVAGKGEGQADERHLWPHQFRLLRDVRPPVWMGEQVAAAVGKNWLDGVYSDLEGIGYAVRSAVVPACAVDAPHRRDRLWIVADASGAERRPITEGWGHVDDRANAGWKEASGRFELGGEGAVADADSTGLWDEPRRLGGTRGAGAGQHLDHHEGPVDDAFGAGLEGHAGHVHDGDRPGRVDEVEAGSVAASGGALPDAHGGRQPLGGQQEHAGVEGAPGRDADGRGPRGPWDGAVWAIGADGKARRIPQSGIRLLAHGVSARVGRLRAYGNAIVPQVAAEVIGAYLDEEALQFMLS